MTMGWHMMLGFSPALFACYIWDGNHSFEMIRRSKECVINIPTTDLVNEAVGIGNCSGDKIDKFKKFRLTPVPAAKVSAPLIKECYANFECKLADGSLISKYGLFIWEVVKAHVAVSPKYPETLHYRGEGVFMVSGRSISLRKNSNHRIGPCIGGQNAKIKPLRVWGQGLDPLRRHPISPIAVAKLKLELGNIRYEVGEGLETISQRILLIFVLFQSPMHPVLDEMIYQ